MKKIFTVTQILICTVLSANAQQPHYTVLEDREIAHNLLNSTVIILIMILTSTFILKLIRLFMNDRLRRSMLEKQTPENIIAKLLPQQKQEKNLAIKWFFLLSAISIGLTATYLTQPIGIHSVLIMSLSAALGFFAYFLFIRNAKD
ncbi:hypothetical protein [Pedobacter duraquae]|uniref:DUF2178 domain-containing protein n=1 Tax=Pedobacter duraquae TaxID=425511 RepID=A0A4R6IP05_9SPHI|nr:hypothetical protein [Pedobacter duraquae]TDO23917.1 hypothetical protein CLV32_0203 [Pedobacter duraquae]